MPLSALVDGRRVIGAELNGAEWDAMRLAARSGSIKMEIRGCRSIAYGRTTLGTQHFVHKPNLGCTYGHKPTSPEHDRIQDLAFKACKKAEWDADVEKPIGDREADVAASKGDVSVVIEVQLSTEDSAELGARTEEYQRHGYEVLWLVPSESPLLRLPRAIAGVQLDSLNNCHVLVPSAPTCDIEEFIHTWLSGERRFVQEARTNVTEVRHHTIHSRRCEQCNQQNLYVSWEHRAKVTIPCLGATRTRPLAPSSWPTATDELAILDTFMASVDFNRENWVQATAERFLPNPFPLQPYLRCAVCSTSLHYPGSEEAQATHDQGSQELGTKSVEILAPHWCTARCDEASRQ